MFRNRGELPNTNTNSNNNRGDSGGYRAPHYSNYWNGRFFIVQYDKTFLAIELISIAIMLLIVLAVYIFTYQIPFQDPISKIKETFLTFQLISIGISLAALVLVTIFTKSSKEKLIKNLRVVAVISILMIIVFLGIKLYMDNKYNEKTFEEFYEQYEQVNNETTTESNIISFGLSGVKISSLKEVYIDESVNAYKNFSIKAMLYIIIHIFIVIIILYLTYRLSVIERKREEIAENDAILYNDEEDMNL